MLIKLSESGLPSKQPSTFLFPQHGILVYLLLGSVRFVVCDVTQWDDQLELFKVALEFSPNNCIDYVVANAGILGNDDLFAFEGTYHYILLGNSASFPDREPGTSNETNTQGYSNRPYCCDVHL